MFLSANHRHSVTGWKLHILSWTLVTAGLIVYSSSLYGVYAHHDPTPAMKSAQDQEQEQEQEQEKEGGEPTVIDRILKDLLETQTPSSLIPFEHMFAFFRGDEGAAYIPVLYKIDPASLTWNGGSADTTVFAMVENAAGEPFHQFEETVSLKKASDGRVMYEFPIQLQPGQYKLYMGVRDNTSEQVGTQIVTIEAPNFERQDLVMSSIIVYREAKEVDEEPGTPGNAFQFGRHHFTPCNSFTKDDTLGMVFYVYGLGQGRADGQPEASVLYRFYKDGELIGQTQEHPLRAEESEAVGTAEIPLSSFEPGNYVVRARVKDVVKDEILNEQIEFVLESDP